MQIVPTGGGAAGTGVSEAKLLVPPGPFPSDHAAPASTGAQPQSGLQPAALQPPAVHTSTLVQAAGLATRATTGQPAFLEDSVLLRKIATADLAQLAQILQPHTTPERTAQVDQLIQQTVEAIQRGRLEFAVGRVIEAAVADPSRVNDLRSLPELTAIRDNVDHSLTRLANVARMDAESKLNTVETSIESDGVQRLPRWETPPETLIGIAHKLLEAGGYENYVRTTALVTELQSAYWGATVVTQVPIAGALRSLKEGDEVEETRAGKPSATLALQLWDALRERLPERAAIVWNRAPLLALLLGWLLIGLAALVVLLFIRGFWPGSVLADSGGFTAELWAVGFLALVGLGFYARLRQR